MNRPVDHAKRAALLDRIVDHLLKTGVTTLALRPLAAEIGTSARMLVHHFRTREALAGEVLIVIETRLAEALADAPRDSTAAGALRRMWAATTTPRMAPLVRAAFEIWGRALVREHEFPGFLDRAYLPWRDGLAAAFEREGSSAADAATRATLAVAAFNGLQLARLTSGEKALTSAALDLLIQNLEPKGDAA